MKNPETGNCITLFISAIRTPDSTQMRNGIDKRIVEEFKSDMLAGDVFPPVDVVFDPKKGDYILVDGHTRIESAKLAEFKRIDAFVLGEGDEQFAQKLALKANAQNSQRRTREDREKAINVCLDHPDFKNATEEEIAEATKTSRREVFRVRQKIGRIKNPERTRDHEYEAAIKIIKEDSPQLADSLAVGIVSMPKEEVVRLAAKDDQERKALVPIMAQRRLTLKQAEQLNLYRPQTEDLPVKTYIDFQERHPNETDWYFRGHTILLTITRLP